MDGGSWAPLLCVVEFGRPNGQDAGIALLTLARAEDRVATKATGASLLPVFGRFGIASIRRKRLQPYGLGTSAFSAGDATPWGLCAVSGGLAYIFRGDIDGA
jgi:hypothetical protein